MHYFGKLYYRLPVCANSSEENSAKVQSVQKFVAQIATSMSKYDRITPPSTLWKINNLENPS